MPLVRSLVIFLFGAGVMFGAWAGGVLDHVHRWFHHDAHMAEEYRDVPRDSAVAPGAAGPHWASPERRDRVMIADRAPGPDGAPAPDDGPIPDGAPPPDAAVPDGPPDGPPLPPDARPRGGLVAMHVHVETADDSVCAPLYSFINHTGLPVIFDPAESREKPAVVPAGGTLAPDSSLAEPTLTEANCGPRVQIVLQQ